MHTLACYRHVGIITSMGVFNSREKIYLNRVFTKFWAAGQESEELYYYICIRVGQLLEFLLAHLTNY